MKLENALNAPVKIQTGNDTHNFIAPIDPRIPMFVDEVGNILGRYDACTQRIGSSTQGHVLTYNALVDLFTMCPQREYEKKKRAFAQKNLPPDTISISGYDDAGIEYRIIRSAPERIEELPPQVEAARKRAEEMSAKNDGTYDKEFCAQITK